MRPRGEPGASWGGILAGKAAARLWPPRIRPCIGAAVLPRNTARDIDHDRRRRLSVAPRVRRRGVLCTQWVHMGSGLHAGVASVSHGTSAARLIAVASRLCHSESENALLI